MAALAIAVIGAVTAGAAIHFADERRDRARVRAEIDEANRQYLNAAIMRGEENQRAVEQARTTAASLAEQDVRDRQRHDALARFNAMSAAEHLEAARAAMLDSYDAQLRVGGDTEEAARQIAPILAASPRDAAALSIQHEIDARDARSRRLVQAAADQFNEHARVERAAALDAAMLHAGMEVESVVAGGARHDILRIRYWGCGRVFLGRAITPDVLAAIRAIGFQRIACGNGFETWDMPL
jgi:hypothetical protein